MSICIADHITYTIREDISITKNELETLWIELDKKDIKMDKNTILGVVYRIPGTDMQIFNNYLQQTLETLTKENKKIIHTGDYNIDILSATKHQHTQEFLDINYGNALIPMFTKPTRISTSSATLIDNLFITNDENTECFKAIIATDISDHFPILFIQNEDVSEKLIKEPRMRRIYNKTNNIKFADQIKENLDGNILNETDPSIAFTKFNDILLRSFNESFPKKPPGKIYETKTKWLTFGLKRSIKHKNKLFIKYRRSPTDNKLKKYKRYKTALQKILKKEEREYYKKELTAHKDNLKKSWDIMKTVINKKRKISTKFVNLKINDLICENKDEIAETFNNFFTQVGNMLDKKIPQTTTDPVTFIKNKNEANLFLKPCTEDETTKIVLKLKDCAAGHDEMPSKILKDNIVFLTKYLTHLLNLSLINGVFPQELKIANIIPIFKAGENDIVSNFRPVSLLTTLSKIFERIFYNRLHDFFVKFKLFYDMQFGFRENHTTSMALLSLMDRIINAMEKDEYTIGIFLDFSKAFDTVNHKILLQKLKAYGVRGIANDWVQDYLRNRQQFTTINGTKSSTQTLTCGVPQGSILGPLLFLIYINDLGTISDTMKLILFADDSNLFIHGKNLEEMTTKINQELPILVDWLRANRLSLNIGKTHYMIFSPRPRSKPLDQNIMIDGIPIDRVHECKFLGIIIDDKITWKPHINYIATKMAKTSGILYKARKYFSKDILLMLYYAFAYPLLLYGNIAWGNSSSNQLRPIIKSQKAMIRIICNLRGRTSTTTFFKKLNILKTEDIYKLSTTCFMFKYSNDQLPEIFQNWFTLIKEVHGYQTRQANIYRMPNYKTQLGSNFIKKQGIELFTKLRDSTKNRPATPFLSLKAVKKITIDQIIEHY